MAALYGWLNQLLAYAESLRPVQSLNTLTSHTAIGTVRQGLGETVAGDSTLTVRVMRVRKVYDNVLLCYDEDQTTTTRTIGTTPRWVLKPYELRHAPFIGQTWGSVRYIAATPANAQRRVALSATGGVGREEQMIVPPYREGTANAVTEQTLGSQIICLRGITGLDPTYNSFTPPTGDVGAGQAQLVEWLDITPGRIWAEYSFTL